MIGLNRVPVNPRLATNYLCLLGYAFIAQMSVTMTATAESPEAQSNTTNAASIVTLGLDGATWDKLLIWALGLAALVAGAVVVTTAGSIITHKREAEAADRSLERYKETVTEKVADAKKEGIEAGRAAADAVARAAEANAEAKKAQLALERYKAPRHISEIIAADMILQLKPFAGTYASVGGAPINFESASLSSQIIDILKKAGIKAEANQDRVDVMLGVARGVVIKHTTGNEKGTELAKIIARFLNMQGISATEIGGLMEDLFEHSPKYGFNRNGDEHSDVIIGVGEKM